MDGYGDPLKGPHFKWGKDRNGRPYKGPNGFDGYGVDPDWAAANGVPGAIAVTPSGYYTPDNEWILYYDRAGTMPARKGRQAVASPKMQAFMSRSRHKIVHS